MTMTPYAPILSYAEVIIPNPHGELQQQGAILLHQLLASGFVKTNQYMVYSQEDQQEIRIAAEPFALVTVTTDAVSLQRTDTQEVWREALGGDPLKQVERLLERLAVSDTTAYGYVAFDLARCYMRSSPLEHMHAPFLSFFVPKLELYLSPETIRLRSLDKGLLEGALDTIISADWQQTLPLVSPEPFPMTEQHAHWYLQGVQAITDAICQDANTGGSFQKAVLSHSIAVSEEGDLDALETYRLVAEENAFARSYCLNLGSETVVGYGSETLLEADATGMVSTNPLADVRGWGRTSEEDARLASLLGSSSKQSMDHLLSVLEAQHEIERVCIAGSVCVRGLARVQRYRAVQHISSRLSGMLTSPYTVWDALRVLFPGVTVSGITKPAALQWITRLEPAPRGLYGGVLGWISSNGAADLAIILHALFQSGKSVRIQAGTGISADSEPRDEYEEVYRHARRMWPYMVRRAETHP